MAALQWPGVAWWWQNPTHRCEALWHQIRRLFAPVPCMHANVDGSSLNIAIFLALLSWLQSSILHVSSTVMLDRRVFLPEVQVHQALVLSQELYLFRASGYC